MSEIDRMDILFEDIQQYSVGGLNVTVGKTIQRYSDIVLYGAALSEKDLRGNDAAGYGVTVKEAIVDLFRLMRAPSLGLIPPF